MAGRHPQGGVSAIPWRKSPGPPRKMPLRTRQKIMVAVHRGPQAVGCGANYWTYKPPCRYAKEKTGHDLTYAGALRASSRWACAARSRAPSTPLRQARVAHRCRRKAKKNLEASGRGGAKGAIHATEDGTTRMSAAHQTGRLKGSRGVGPLFQTAWTRGGRPVPAGGSGAENLRRPQARVQEQRRGQAVDARKAHPPGLLHKHEPQGARRRRAGGLQSRAGA